MLVHKSSHLWVHGTAICNKQATSTSSTRRLHSFQALATKITLALLIGRLRLLWVSPRVFSSLAQPVNATELRRGHAFAHSLLHASLSDIGQCPFDPKKHIDIAWARAVHTQEALPRNAAPCHQPLASLGSACLQRTRNSNFKATMCTLHPAREQPESSSLRVFKERRC